MGGEEEGVFTAAIDQSEFFDVIVCEVGEGGCPRQCLEAPSQLRLTSETVPLSSVVMW